MFELMFYNPVNMFFLCLYVILGLTTVLPAKSDSDIMFCL